MSSTPGARSGGSRVHCTARKPGSSQVGKSFLKKTPDFQGTESDWEEEERALLRKRSGHSPGAAVHGEGEGDQPRSLGYEEHCWEKLA